MRIDIRYFYTAIFYGLIGVQGQLALAIPIDVKADFYFGPDISRNQACDNAREAAKSKAIAMVTGEIYVLSKDEGGRHTPFFNNYRPQFYFRTTDVTGAIELPEGKEMVMPGDNVSITVKLINPIAMEEGLRFAIREGGRTVGAGVVAKILA